MLKVRWKDGSYHWVIKTWKKKSWRISALSFRIFMGKSVSWLAFAESKLKFFKTNLFLIYMRIAKRRALFSVACFSYFEYDWVIAIFYNGFNNWIIDVISNWVTVNIFCNFKVAYNIAKEGISICTVSISISTILPS